MDTQKKSQKSPAPLLVDAAALAFRYGISVKTVRKWGREGKIPFVRLSGKCTRYPLEACDQIVEQLRVKALPK